ncbi:HNH endonuclease [Arthrobacter sp. GMC3]|uniref:HNH endonuclease n=1 Tax=Arthrobacter sp. GMC3 TaxID=2058894 RepID=UPI000CE33C21|nr:HNH endonuclease [Arthrobacter sp. GMC3]
MADDYLSLSGPQRRALLDTALQTYGWVCCICGLPIRDGQESLQHVIPRSKGGITELATNKPAHKRCNYSLGNRVLDQETALIENGEHYFTKE